MVRLKGECEGKAPTIKGSLGVKSTRFRTGTFLLNIFPYGPDEVRMGNLGV